MTRQHPVRGDLALPDGWKVTHHATVQVLDHPKLHPADLPVRGQWRAIEHAPDSGWWLQPKDTAADWWMARHGKAAGAQSNMINVHRLRLIPWWVQLPLPGT